MSDLLPIPVCAGCGTPLQPSPTRPRKWCSERCRKGSYGDPCVDCGVRTVFGAERARVPEPRCPACATAKRRVWTQEAVITAIQWWVAEYGEPPAEADWSATFSEYLNDPERAARARRLNAEGRIPSFMTLVRTFGSWSAGIVAAGFTPHAPHGGGANVARRRSQRAKRFEVSA